MKLNFSVPVIALMAGAAIGFCLRSTPTGGGDEAVGGEKKHTPSQIQDASGDAAVATLRARIKELEAQLAASSERVGADAPVGNVMEERREPQGRFNMREMMEHIKTEDPERYAHMTNAMARFRRHRTEQAQSRLDFFGSIDLTGLGEEAQETHTQLQTMIAKREELEEKMHDETLSDDDREATMREVFAMEHEMRDLYHKERENLITETVRELGFADDDAADVVATLKDIIKATSSNFGPPHGGGPGGPGGRRR